jgi:hypothetical protein
MSRFHLQDHALSTTILAVDLGKFNRVLGRRK